MITTSHSPRPVRRTAAAAALLVLAGAGVLTGTGMAQEADPLEPAPTPQLACGPGSKPELGIQGRVSAAEYASGRAAEGYTCNAEVVSRYGTTGGFQVHRYVDAAGRECAYYDSTLLFPGSAVQGSDGAGVYVLDMSDPTAPVLTTTLTTPAMLTPHESLRLNEERGLLAAGAGSPATQAGFVDVYDLTEDCRFPVLRSSTPLGVFGHESAFSPDGLTFWVTGTLAPTVNAIDLTDPALPRVVWSSVGEYNLHGMRLSEDGRTLYGADARNLFRGLTILDVTQVQERAAVPVVTLVSRTTWPTVSIPQNSDPVVLGGKPYLVEMDEYASNTLNGPPGYDPNAYVGAGRIIDIGDPAEPVVVSDLRLAVHQRAARATDQRADPGASSGTQGYAGHYCAVPRRVEPTIAACSMIASGLRVFDIRDPLRPVEIAYVNMPDEGGGFAMSAPTFALERDEIWYSDGNSGFYVVRLTGAARAVARGEAPPSAGGAVPPVTAAPPPPAAPAGPSGSRLPATGGAPLVAVAALLTAGSALLLARQRRAR